MFGQRSVSLAIVIIAVVVIGFEHILAEKNDYCSLCDNHIGCNNNGSFGRNCSSDRAIVRMTTCHRQFILMLHNQWRNKIALGKLPGYETAKRMPTMEWSKELQYLAELNARSCNYGHDDCRATKAFPYAGQNIARRGNSRDYEPAQDSIKSMIDDWFTEYEDADMTYIHAYRNHDQGKKLGHFTIMANERNNRVGCALGRYQAGGYKNNYLVCNYAYTNIYDETVYTVGKVASGCKTGKHTVYGGLCNTKEPIKPLPGKSGNPN